MASTCGGVVRIMRPEDSYLIFGRTQSAKGDSVPSKSFKCYSPESIALLRRGGCETRGREESILLGNGSS